MPKDKPLHLNCEITSNPRLPLHCLPFFIMPEISLVIHRSLNSEVLYEKIQATMASILKLQQH